MYEFRPVSDRVGRLRERYRNTQVILDSEHARIVTESYRKNSHETPILKRAKCLYDVCAERTVRVEEDELIVGNMGVNYRGTSISPDYGMEWLIDELDSGEFDKRDTSLEHMELSEEDRVYFREMYPFWKENCASAFIDRAMPIGFEDALKGGVLSHRPKGNADMPTGHFNANYRTLLTKGFGGIREEAVRKLEEMKGRVFGDDPERYLFYQAIIIVCDGAILLSKRYAEECRRKAKNAPAVRQKELLSMAESLDRIMENPCETFHDAVQAVFLYQIILAVDGNLSGISFGRFDQYTYPYLKSDLENGRITEAEAQELVDCFFLKICDMFKGRSLFVSRGAGGYTSGQQMSLGGVDKDGNDASNLLSYMMLETSARLLLHSPPLSLRIHKETPKKLWEAALETTKRAGGIPTFQNDDIIIPMMQAEGYSLEDARDYCIIGCVEPGGSGNDFSACGGAHAKAYLNMVNCLNTALNNGINPLTGEDCGLKTGFLYEMETFDEVKAAYQKAVDYFVDWQISINNMMDYMTRSIMPIPVLSAMLDGCMENGKDCTAGGAKYNGCGSAAVGCGTVANALEAIRYLVFDRKLCSARDLYDAWTSNWEGCEELRQRIINEAPKYGNGDCDADRLASWAMEVYSSRYNNGKSIRGNFKAGMFSVSAHIPMGLSTFASLDGRKTGQPLSDGISPSQGSDRNGPTAVLLGAGELIQSHVFNGTLLNMKFHPRSVEGEEGVSKLIQLIKTYFAMGGMHIQLNIIGSDTLRAAQKDPDKYKDLVIRVAGFSAYFVELYKTLQDDLISRTDQQV